MILDVLDGFIVVYLLSQPIVRILLYLALLFLVGYFMLTFMLGRNFLKARIVKAFFGREMICDIDQDNSQSWRNPYKKIGTLITGDAAYDIAKASVVRGADCDFYITNRPLGRTLTPEVIKAANNLTHAGYKNFAHAYLSMIASKYEKLYDDMVVKAIGEKKDVENALREFDKKVYEGLMKPDNTDFLTKNVAILFQWSNQKLSAYGNKQIIEQVKLETEQENKRTGVSLEKLVGYAVAAAIVFIAGAIAYNMIGGSGGTIIMNQAAATTTTLLPI